MAIGPDGTPLPEPGQGAGLGLAADGVAFLRGLEGVVDRALRTYRRGAPFVFGIHQEIDDAIIQAVVRRYTAAGWSEVRLTEGETGAHMLVMIP